MKISDILHEINKTVIYDVNWPFVLSAINFIWSHVPFAKLVILLLRNDTRLQIGQPNVLIRVFMLNIFTININKRIKRADVFQSMFTLEKEKMW